MFVPFPERRDGEPERERAPHWWSVGPLLFESEKLMGVVVIPPPKES